MTSGGDDGEQLALLTPAVSAKSAAREAATSGPKATSATSLVATTDPVAAVWVDTGLAHLDRPFDYLVPAALDEAAQPGARVKVRFAGRDLPGFVVGRGPLGDGTRKLAPIRTVVSPEPVLTPPVLAAAQVLAERYAGTVGDIVRLAVPPRHAAAEKALPMEPSGLPPLSPWTGPAAWQPYAAAEALLARIAAGKAPGAAWLALPSQPAPTDWPTAFAQAARVAVEAGRGALLIVPDHRDVDRLEAAVRETLGPAYVVRLTADQGPQARYTAWLKALRGHAPVVIGTRAAAYAPVRDLGLVAWWDDGDDLLDEPRSPYVPVRDVLLTRARIEGAAVIAGGFVRSVAVQQLIDAGRLAPVSAPPAVVRTVAPRVQVAGDDAHQARDAAARSAQLPSVAWSAAKAALADGPVLVQVPRRGYAPALSCATCRAPARCATCAGPLAADGPQAVPTCRWCGRTALDYTCRTCGGHDLRRAVTGARRTAEDLGRAFRGVPVHTSGAGPVLARVAATPALIIATPGAEPVADGGYAATLLLDAWALLDRPTLDASEEALRRWAAAAALTRPASQGGVVVLAGAPPHTTLPAVEALVRWDPAWLAERELRERDGLSLPPAMRTVAVTGERAAVAAFLADLSLPDRVVTLGPTPVERFGMPSGEPPAYRAVFMVPTVDGDPLVAEIRAAKARRSGRKDGGGLRVQVDPRDPGA